MPKIVVVSYPVRDERLFGLTMLLAILLVLFLFLGLVAYLATSHQDYNKKNNYLYAPHSSVAAVSLCI